MKELDWEEEFDEYVQGLMRHNNDMLVRSAAGGFKIFFQKALTAKEDALRKAVGEMYFSTGCGGESRSCGSEKYNQALDEVLSLLTPKNHEDV